MISDRLPYDEQKTLEAICRFHGVGDDDPELIKHLATFANWIRQDEQDKARLNRVPQAPFLISLLSLMGIYGGAAMEPAKRSKA